MKILWSLDADPVDVMGAIRVEAENGTTLEDSFTNLDVFLNGLVAVLDALRDTESVRVDLVLEPDALTGTRARNGTITLTYGIQAISIRDQDAFRLALRNAARDLLRFLPPGARLGEEPLRSLQAFVQCDFR